MLADYGVTHVFMVPAILRRTLAELERRHVMSALEAARGNRQTAAHILGISPRTLARMLHRWGLAPPRD
jgi:DNA-binding NtrC family response regulator